MPALLHQTPAGDLDKFISKFLQPDRHFLDQVKKAVDTICSFLKENCFRNSPIKVLKVVKVRPDKLQVRGLLWTGPLSSHLMGSSDVHVYSKGKRWLIQLESSLLTGTA